MGAAENFKIHFELPRSYEENEIVLMVRNPFCLFAYWNLSAEVQYVISKYFNRDWESISLILRLYEIADGGVARCVREVGVPPESRKCYFDNLHPGCSYYASLGIKTPEGEVHQVLHSNRIVTPSIAGIPTWKRATVSAEEVSKEEYYGYEERLDFFSFS
jgi:hypothetical protein